MPLSLLCDEHIPYAVIDGLVGRGIDATSVILFHESEKYDIGRAIDIVQLACETLSPDEMRNRVEFL